MAETPTEVLDAREDVVQRRITEALAAQEEGINDRIRLAVADAADETLAAQEKVIQGRIKNAIRAYQRRAIGGFLVLFLGLGGAFYLDRQHNEDRRKEIIQQGAKQDRAIVASGDAIAITGCNRDYETIDALRDQLEVSLKRIDSLEKDGTYSPRQAEVARDSTREFLSKYHLPDCREADNTLTAEPKKPIIVPAPRYPDDPEQRKDEKRDAKKRDPVIAP